MDWHSYRIVSDAAVLLVALMVVAYCCISPSRRAYRLGFALLSAAAAGELIREVMWPHRGTRADVVFTTTDVGLMAVGAYVILNRWREEKRSHYD